MTFIHDLLPALTDDALAQLIDKAQTILSKRGSSKGPLMIRHMGFNARAYNAIRMNGMKTAADLKNLDIEKVRRWRNIGAKTVENIIEVCEKHGINL